MENPVYEAVFERDDNNTWLVTVPSVKGVHSFGRTLRSARQNIREALALVLDNDDETGLDLIEKIDLPKDTEELLKNARSRRELAEIAIKGASSWTKAVVRVLTEELGLSLRDTAELVGVSFQRVQQIRREQAAGQQHPNQRPALQVLQGERQDDVQILDLMEALKASIDATRTGIPQHAKVRQQAEQTA